MLNVLRVQNNVSRNICTTHAGEVRGQHDASPLYVFESCLATAEPNIEQHLRNLMLRESKHLLIRLRPSGQASVVSGPLATSVACLGPGHGRKASSRMCGAGARPYMLVLKFACLSVGGRCGAMYIVPRLTHTHTHTHTHTPNWSIVVIRIWDPIRRHWGCGLAWSQ
jgi:hypothetical protein